MSVGIDGETYLSEADIIERIAEKQPILLRLDIELAVGVLFERMCRALVEGDEVFLQCWGTFVVTPAGSVRFFPSRGGFEKELRLVPQGGRARYRKLSGIWRYRKVRGKKYRVGKTTQGDK